jgi:hypothetical protein
MDAAEIILVHQLLGLYGHIVDAGQWDRFGELFTDDAILDYTAVRAPQVFRGIDEIRGYFEGGNHPSAHHVVNIVVWEEGGEVRAHSKFLAPFTRPTHVPLRWYGGDYEDLVVLTPAGWRFRRRVCTPRWQFTSAEPSQDIPDYRRTW